MSPPASEEANASASPASLITQETASSAIGETTPNPSPEITIHQQQTGEPTSAVEKGMSSAPLAITTGPLPHLGPSDYVQGQLPGQTTELDNNTRHPKSDQDSSRELVKYTLLQAELAQIREENLDLRVELQLARNKHEALETQHNECKKRKRQIGKVVKKAIRNLSTSLDLSNGDSAEPGWVTERVKPGVPLPPKQSVSDPTVEKDSSTPSAFQVGFTSSTGEGSPVQANIFGQTSVIGTSTSFFDPPKVNKPIQTMHGDPKASCQVGHQSTIFQVSTLGAYDNQKQSFEETRLRRYEMSKNEKVPLQTPKWLGSLGDITIPTGYNNPFKLLAQQRNKGKFRDEAGGRGGQNRGGVEDAGAKSGGSFKLAKLEGDGMANVSSANTDTGKDTSIWSYRTSDSKGRDDTVSGCRRSGGR